MKDFLCKHPNDCPFPELVNIVETVGNPGERKFVPCTRSTCHYGTVVTGENTADDRVKPQDKPSDQ